MIFKQLERYQHEEVVFCSDKTTGLRALIAIHSTSLGPAVGGTRMWAYTSEEAALDDLLRLSENMTYQTAIAGCDSGGGMAVLWGDPEQDKDEAYLRAFGRFVEGLHGRFITYPDLGTTEADIYQISRETKHVLRLRGENGKILDVAKITAYGLLWGMKACAKAVLRTSSLKNLRIAIQDVTQIGSHLVDYLVGEGARLTITDTNYDSIKNVQDRHKDIAVVDPEDIYSSDCDIFSPCARSRVLDGEAVGKLRCKIVAGAAACVLDNEGLAEVLHKKKILYAPDFAVRCGEMLVAGAQSRDLPPEKRFEAAARVYDIMAQVISSARKQKISPHRAAKKIAEERIERVGRVRRILS
jgi:leucine dehydrogenase